MSHFSRSVRIAVAGLLAVSALTVFGASPASAAVTASMVDNGDGSVTLTYSGVTANDNIVLLGLLNFNTTCTTGLTPPNATFFLTSDPLAPGGAVTASPMTIEEGTAAYTTNGVAGTISIEEGFYTLCLFELISGQGQTLLQQLDVTFGSVAPTTTTTTTAPAADPVAPAFTG